MIDGGGNANNTAIGDLDAVARIPAELIPPMVVVPAPIMPGTTVRARRWRCWPP